MDTGKSSPWSVFKSKKPFHSPAASDQKKKRRVSDPDLNPNPLSVKTLGKEVHPPRQLRRQTIVMSINEVRQAAMKLRNPESDSSAQLKPESECSKKPISASKKKSVVKLSEKYQLLEEFFNSM